MIDIHTRLKRSILTNDLLVLKRLVSSNPNCLSFCDPSDSGNTPLHLAASLGLYSIVVFLVASGHEKTGISRNYEGKTPLMVAAGSSEEAADDVVFYLADEFKGSVGWRDKSGMTALMAAAKVGNDSNINILLDAEADINAFDPLGNTALHYASAYGHLKAIRTLIDRGANFDHRNREGWYAKDYSFSKAAEQYFKTLIDGVAIKNMTSSGQLPIGGAFTANTPIIPGQVYNSSAPSSRDGSKRPSTAGSFSFSTNTAATSTSTLVPGNMGLPPFGPVLGNLGSTITLVPASGPGTPVDDLPPPPTRTLKSAASMVEFSRMDRSTSFSSVRPATPQGGSSSGMEHSSPSAVSVGARRREGSVGRHSATGSVSSYASVGSVGSFQGGLPVVMQGQQQGAQPGGRSLYDQFTKLRPRASSNG